MSCDYFSGTLAEYRGGSARHHLRPPRGTYGPPINTVVGDWHPDELPENIHELLPKVKTDKRYGKLTEEFKAFVKRQQSLGIFRPPYTKGEA